jgi:hypothetical protein
MAQSINSAVIEGDGMNYQQIEGAINEMMVARKATGLTQGRADWSAHCNEHIWD